MLLAIAKFIDSSDSSYKTWYFLQLALKDADKLMNRQSSSVKSYNTKACALMLVCAELFSLDSFCFMSMYYQEFLGLLHVTCVNFLYILQLERYEVARDTILSGLQIDPFRYIYVYCYFIMYWCLTECVVFKFGIFLIAWSDPLRSNLQELEKVMPYSMRKTHGKAERSDDFDCTVCLKLLYEPATTPCGHTFCRSCLFQSMDRGGFIWLIVVNSWKTSSFTIVLFINALWNLGNKCPLCRTVIFMTPRTCAVR